MRNQNCVQGKQGHNETVRNSMIIVLSIYEFIKRVSTATHYKCLQRVFNSTTRVYQRGCNSTTKVYQSLKGL